MSFDFDLLEEQDPAQFSQPPPLPARPLPASLPLQQLRVRLATPGAGLAAEFPLPAAASLAELKAEVQRRLGCEPAEQRLAVGTVVLEDGDAPLRERAERGTGLLDVTLVRVACARRVALGGGLGGGAKLWDLERREELFELPDAAGGAVACCALDWPGRRALLGGEDCRLHLWDLEGKRPLRAFEGHTARVAALDVDWARGRALSGSADCSLRLWDLGKRGSLREFKGHAGAVLCVAMDARLQLGISGGEDCVVRMWHLEDGSCTQEIQGHQTAVSCVAPDFAGNFAITGSFATLRMWDLRGYAWHSDLPGHGAEVTCLAAHWPTRRALSGSADGTLRLWAPSSGSRGGVPIFFNAARPFGCEAIFRAQQRVSCLSVDWELGQAVSGGHAGLLQLWDLATGALLAQLDGGDGLLCVAASGAQRAVEETAEEAPASEQGEQGLSSSTLLPGFPAAGFAPQLWETWRFATYTG